MIVPKPLQRKHRRLPEKKAVTIGIGMLCTNGV
jgi:hypothetical protein